LNTECIYQDSTKTFCMVLEWSSAWKKIIKS